MLRVFRFPGFIPVLRYGGTGHRPGIPRPRCRQYISPWTGGREDALGSHRARLLALSAVVMWSTAASAFKITLRYGSPYQILLVATAVSALVCLVSVLADRARTGKVAAPGGRALLAAALRGLLNPFLYYLVLLEAYSRLPAQTAMVINYLWPVVLVLLSAPMLGQRVGMPVLGAVVLSFSGVAVMALGGGGVTGIPADLPAAGLAFLSTVIWSLYWLLNMRDGSPGNVKLLLNLCFGLVYLSAWGLLRGGPGPLPRQVLLGGAYIGVFEMGFAYLLWMKALTVAGTTAEVGSMVFLTPFIALGLIGIVVGESIGMPTVAGLLLVVAGILLQRRLQLGGQKRS
jgi:drug/metabolite transporter (DMT)-like permease